MTPRTGDAMRVLIEEALAIEAQEGTDAMLRRVAHDIPPAVRGQPGSYRGVIAKAPKPIQEARIDILRFQRQPPASLFRREGAQQLSVTVHGDCRAALRGRIVERTERGDVILPRRGHAETQSRGDDHRRGIFASSFALARACAHRCTYFALVTVTVPKAVRPKRSGRYMSSIDAGGSTYCPGVTARTT